MLKSLRILAIEQYGADPFGTQFLSDMVVEVMKVENRAHVGDAGRTLGLAWLESGDARTRSLFFQGLNRGKQSLSLDQDRPEGRAVLMEILAGSDAVMSNLRGDVRRKLGLTYDVLAPQFPHIGCEQGHAATLRAHN